MMARIIFDLDGTLVDSAGEIHAAVSRMLEEENAPALDLATVTSFVGHGLPKLVEQVIGAAGLDMARHEALTGRALAHFNEIGGGMTRPYPGVREALGALQAAGHKLGICTNKPEEPARHILTRLDLGAFDVVIGGDTLPMRKPDAAPLLAAAQALGAGPVIYVGDSDVDAETAQAAGLPFLLFTEGYRKRPVAELYHSDSFERFDQLPAQVTRILATQGD